MCRVVNAHVTRSSKDPATTGLETVNGGMVTIILIAVPGRIWVEVIDDGCTPVPAVCPYQQEQLKLAEDGRGLQLVEILSARWELLQRRCGHGHLVRASAASGNVCLGDNAAESFVVGVVVAPDDVPADHAGLFLVAGVVGAVQREVPQGGELCLYAV
jgi:hypothetical protein